MLPPLTTSEEDLQDGIARINSSLEVALERLGLSEGSHKAAQAAALKI